MKLVKINTDHYVVVDDSGIEQDDYITRLSNKEITKANDEWCGDTHEDWKKITHSTHKLYKNDFWAIRELRLSEVKELVGEVDVEKKGIKLTDHQKELLNIGNVSYKDSSIIYYLPYIFINQNGKWYMQLKDNKEKKYTEEDIKVAILQAFLSGTERLEDFEKVEKMILENIQLKTEWEVEFVNGKLKLKL